MINITITEFIKHLKVLMNFLKWKIDQNGFRLRSIRLIFEGLDF